MPLRSNDVRVRTIKAPVQVEGIGIHTGTVSRVTLLPHDGVNNGAFSAHKGIVFRSAQGEVIPATANAVVDTSRCTVLGKNGSKISTIEHLMSALAGLGINSLAVTVDGSELPIGDGSAMIWQEAIASVGVHDLPVTPFSTPYLPIIITGTNSAFVAAYPSDKLTITVAVTFDHPLIGTQVAHYDEMTNNYRTEIAPARTFGFIEEVEALRKAGLALGGSEENAVIVYPDRYSKPLRFDNELARHKLLDLMGDLALAGLPLSAMEVVAVKPSHRLNVEFAKALAANTFLGSVVPPAD